MTRKPIIYTADAARIDEHRDGRIAIIVDTDEGDKLYVDIHSVALDFYASVQRDLRPYALEAEHARAAVAAGVSLEDYTHVPFAPPVESSVDMDLVRDLERGK